MINYFSFTSLAILIALILGLITGFMVAIVMKSKDDKKKKAFSLKTQRSILGGKFSEQLAPYLPGFPSDLKVSEARFVGSPVDFIVYKGSDDKNITEVVFVEVKTGTSSLNENERSLKQVIDEKRVRWVKYTAPVVNIKND